MAAFPLRRGSGLLSQACFRYLLRKCNFCSKTSAIGDGAAGWTKEAPAGRRPSTLSSSNIYLSPLFRDPTTHLDRYDIELVDNDAWQVTSGIAHAFGGSDKKCEAHSASEAADSQVIEHSSTSSSLDDPDFDEIDNMRIRGNLFYKLDRHSKEYEEYSFDFHRRKKKGDDSRDNQKKESSTKNEQPKESKKKEDSSPVEAKRTTLVAKNGKAYTLMNDSSDVFGSVADKKKVRTLTFNQLTAPYHEPFCLDIHISNASVRASVIHRGTSKVVAVAHSISKDIKFDLGSTRNEATCRAVGQILTQRALEDDIHNVVYTPRRGERLEGKLQIVLQSIIDSGLSVKVKLKQRKQQKKLSLPQYFA